MSRAGKRSNQGPQLAALLRLASQAMAERLAAWLSASEFKELQPAHSAAIQPLWEHPEGKRITALARDSRITKQSMSALVAELEAAGYVERVADVQDARASRVKLTEQGRAYGRAVRAFARQVEAEWAARIGDERVDALCATLLLIRERVIAPDDSDRARRSSAVVRQVR